MTRTSSECNVWKLRLSRWAIDAICRALAWQKTDVTLRPELLLLSHTALVMRSLDVLQCLIFFVVLCLIDLKKTSEDHDPLFEIFVHRIPRQLLFLWVFFFVSLIPDEHRDSILLLAWPLASYSLYCYYPLQTHPSHFGVTFNDYAARDHVFCLAL